MEIAGEYLAELADDGDKVELADGRSLVLKIESDPDTSVMDDGDWFGALEWARHDGQRPDGFDGRARVVRHDWPERLWWQPPSDVTDENLPKFQSHLSDLLEWGYSQVGLELHEWVTDSTGNEHDVIVDEAWIGGGDLTPTTYDRQYVGTLVRDLAHDLAEVVGS